MSYSINVTAKQLKAIKPSGDAPYIILNDEIVEWLKLHRINCTFTARSPVSTSFVVFQTAEHLALFKLTWL